MAKQKNLVTTAISWVSSLRRNSIIAALFLLIQGIFFIAKPDTDPTGIAKFVAVLVILAGAVSVLSYIIAKDRTLIGTVLMILSAAMIVAGIILFIRTDIMAVILKYDLAIVTAAGGIGAVAQALKLDGEKRWQKVVSIAAGIFLIGLGVAMLVATYEVSTVMKRAIGFVLILNAALQIWGAIQLTRTMKAETE